jgi:hypothetical protein
LHGETVTPFGERLASIEIFAREKEVISKRRSSEKSQSGKDYKGAKERRRCHIV